MFTALEEKYAWHTIYPAANKETDAWKWKNIVQSEYVKNKSGVVIEFWVPEELKINKAEKPDDIPDLEVGDTVTLCDRQYVVIHGDNPEITSYRLRLFQIRERYACI